MQKGRKRIHNTLKERQQASRERIKQRNAANARDADAWRQLTRNAVNSRVLQGDEEPLRAVALLSSALRK